MRAIEVDSPPLAATHEVILKPRLIPFSVPRTMLYAGSVVEPGCDSMCVTVILNMPFGPVHAAIEPTLIIFPFLSAIEDSKVGFLATVATFFIGCMIFGINDVVVCVGAIQSPLVST